MPYASLTVASIHLAGVCIRTARGIVIRVCVLVKGARQTAGRLVSAGLMMALG